MKKRQHKKIEKKQKQAVSEILDRLAELVRGRIDGNKISF